MDIYSIFGISLSAGLAAFGIGYAYPTQRIRPACTMIAARDQPEFAIRQVAFALTDIAFRSP